MQNSLSVPLKDQGESGTVPSGRGGQTKSHFRTIAPKIVPKVPASRALPCRSLPSSHHPSPGPAIGPTSLVMPSQNYALMQLTGQEGTFSLVALPPVPSAQKPRIPLPENLKLPIPRYQPPRNSKASRTSHSQPQVQTQARPQMSSPPHSRPDGPHKTVSSQQALSPNEAPGTLGTTTLPDGGGLIASGPTLTSSRRGVNTPSPPRPPGPREPPAGQAHPRVSGTPSFASKKACSKPSTIHLSKAMASLPPAVLGSAVQLLWPVPKEKLPILPYARRSTADLCKREPEAPVATLSSPGHRADCCWVPSVTGGSPAATRMTDETPGPLASGPSESARCPAPKLDLRPETTQNGGSSRRRARKQKSPEEILALPGKKRKCLPSKCRDHKERVRNDPQQPRNQKPVKKYRSIMPKPVLVTPALAPLTPPAAALPPPAPGGLLAPKAPGPQPTAGPSPKPSVAFRSGCAGPRKPWHRCQVCSRNFLFKQHLRDHMHTHTHRQPYSCRICRKTYVHSSSLSTHMKRHHGESRPKRLLCCEFCAKVFGHVRVYFGHLKEVHRVSISTEPSPGKLQPGDLPKTQGTEEAAERENNSSPEGDLFLNRVDEVKLQITCSRCQIMTQSFSEINFHLLYVHGEEIQGRLREGLFPGSRGAPGELAKHPPPDGKQCPERRKLGGPCPSEEELPVCPNWKRQLCLHPQKKVQTQMKTEGAHLGPREPEDPQGPPHPTSDTVLLHSHVGFHCLLCSQTLGQREELLLHWAQQHHCEDPGRLWALFSAFSSQGVIHFPMG
ncbi:zinc finger protein 438 [Echinops telfairi]|uniref:Zinc finger protein 438 n=2 Tax=Echinops telfairi TaxID=9371 RepID=A0AC55D2S0_ECHTE|nr:zinc finger protein 438 [Echinops telfairi]XP_045146037.1 zinc finger protein 438 [Echinops telfairi]